MQLSNLTSFAATAFRQMAGPDEYDGIVAVRGAFTLRQHSPMVAKGSKPDFQWADGYAGSPHTSCLVRPTDLVPYKPGTDVTVLGDAITPDGKAHPSWQVGIRIAGRFERCLQVTGPRRWVPEKRPLFRFGRNKPSWTLSAPEPVRRVKLCWTLAVGGAVLGLDQAEPDCHPDNPLGIGMLDESRSAADREYPAAQIEMPDQPLEQARGAAQPAGFGSISPWWRPRLQYAGTYDTAWQASRHPLLPEDFDDRFWQAAAPGMVIEPWLEGDERITLGNLTARPVFDTALPGVRIVLRVHRPGERYEDRALALDGVHFDLRNDTLDCFLTWRVRFPLNDAVLARLVLRAVDMQNRRLQQPALRMPVSA